MPNPICAFNLIQFVAAIVHSLANAPPHFHSIKYNFKYFVLSVFALDQFRVKTVGPLAPYCVLPICLWLCCL